MRIPLFQDIWSQRGPLKVFVVKLMVMAILFGGIDRLTANILVKGIKSAYGLDAPAKVLCVGHSHTVLGIDSTLLERRLGVPVAEYARNGANVADRLAMIRQYLEAQPSSVEMLVYDVDAYIFARKGLSLNSYVLFYPFMDSDVVDAYVRRYAPWNEYCLRRIFKLRRFDLDTCNSAIRGLLHVDANLKRGAVDVGRLERIVAQKKIPRIHVDRDCVAEFEATLQLAAKKGIHVVLAYIPTVDIYNSAFPQEYAQVIQLLEDYSDKFDNVTFFNYNPAFAHRYELFYDQEHLNPAGQRLVTEALARDLASFREHEKAGLLTMTAGCGLKNPLRGEQ